MIFFAVNHKNHVFYSTKCEYFALYLLVKKTYYFMSLLIEQLIIIVKLFQENSRK